MTMRGHSRRRGTEAGFTLAEVMIAVGILGASMFVLVSAHHGSLRLYGDAQETATARLLLEQALGQAELVVMLGELSGEGDFGPRYAGYSYSFEAMLWNEQVPGLFNVTVWIMGPESEVTMNMYVYGSGDKWKESDLLDAKPSNTKGGKTGQRGSDRAPRKP